MVDESMDGICRDEPGRCTLRAALLKLTRSASVPTSFSVTGTITMDATVGSFGIPPESVIDGEGER
jgi:hypothetical protein